MDQNLKLGSLDQNQALKQLASPQGSGYILHTFGCKVNTYDSGLIQKNLSQHGYEQIKAKENERLAQKIANNKSAIHVLNTCAVTAEATKEAVKLIRRIKAQQPFSTIVITGCAAQVDTNVFSDLAGVDLVVANSHKGLLPDLINKHYRGELKEKVFKSNIFKKEDLEMGGGLEQNHTRSFLKIQDGCNSFCSFCIIPYARGKSRSIPINGLVRRVQELQEQGFQEVVLTGVHIGDYEDTAPALAAQNSKKGLENLIEAILLKTTIPRLRLSSLEPIEVTDHLLELYSDKRLCPHFHMSIQSADSEVLRQMKRQYTENEVMQSLHNISNKVPNVFIGIDVIAGFPTETDEQFENTYKNLAESPWTRLHVFPYSERAGTRAQTLPQIPFHRRKERAARLRELSLHRFQSEGLKQVGTQQETLILTKPAKEADGLTNHYWPVRLINKDIFENSQASTSAHTSPASRLVQTKITGFFPDVGEGVLEGVILT